MRKLRWSTQSWLEHFRGSGDTGWGELVMSGGYGRQSEDQVQAAAVSSAQNWYSEVTKPGFDRKSVDRYVFNMGMVHYTQLVWADTEELGCGMVHYKYEGLFRTAPRTYKSGQACSACPAGYTREDELCAKNATP